MNKDTSRFSDKDIEALVEAHPHLNDRAAADLVQLPVIMEDRLRGLSGNTGFFATLQRMLLPKETDRAHAELFRDAASGIRATHEWLLHNEGRFRRHGLWIEQLADMVRLLHRSASKSEERIDQIAADLEMLESQVRERFQEMEDRLATVELSLAGQRDLESLAAGARERRADVPALVHALLTMDGLIWGSHGSLLRRLRRGKGVEDARKEKEVAASKLADGFATILPIQGQGFCVTEDLIADAAHGLDPAARALVLDITIHDVPRTPILQRLRDVVRGDEALEHPGAQLPIVLSPRRLFERLHEELYRSACYLPPVRESSGETV